MGTAASRRAACLSAAVFIALPAAVHAGQPLATDDADAKARGACEWETSATGEASADGSRNRAWTSTVGCGIGWDTELGVGFGHTRGDGATQRLWSLSGKTGLRTRTDTEPGIALAWTVLADQSPGVPPKAHGALLSGVLSQPVTGGWTLHANLGASHDRADKRTRLAWAMAVERAVSEQVDVTAETFGVGSDDPWGALGLRWTANAQVTAGLAASRDFSPARTRTLALTVTVAF